MDELLPCPRGHDHKVAMNADLEGKWKWVECQCGMSGPADLGESGAIEAWNDRPLESALRARVAELEKQLEKWEEFSPNFPPGYCENP